MGSTSGPHARRADLERLPAQRLAAAGDSEGAQWVYDAAAELERLRAENEQLRGQRDRAAARFGRVLGAACEAFESAGYDLEERDDDLAGMVRALTGERDEARARAVDAERRLMDALVRVEELEPFLAVIPCSNPTEHEELEHARVASQQIAEWREAERAELERLRADLALRDEALDERNHEYDELRGQHRELRDERNLAVGELDIAQREIEGQLRLQGEMNEVAGKIQGELERLRARDEPAQAVVRDYRSLLGNEDLMLAVLLPPWLRSSLDALAAVHEGATEGEEESR